MSIEKLGWGTQGEYVKKVVHIETKFESVLFELPVNVCIFVSFLVALFKYY